MPEQPDHDKQAFATRRQAQAAAIVARTRFASSGKGRLEPYQCKQCGLWHLATKYREETNW